MPTKIVSSASEPLKGEINKHDLDKIHNDYLHELKLDSTAWRHFKKTNGFYIDINILKAFIANAEAAGPAYTKVFMQFGVTLPNQTTCYAPYADISNSITVSLFIADDKHNIKNQIGDGVLTAGFKALAVTSAKAAPARDLTCCGNPHVGS